MLLETSAATLTPHGSAARPASHALLLAMLLCPHGARAPPIASFVRDVIGSTIGMDIETRVGGWTAVWSQSVSPASRLPPNPERMP
jgi:hypothetical protein